MRVDANLANDITDQLLSKHPRETQWGYAMVSHEVYHLVNGNVSTGRLKYLIDMVYVRLSKHKMK